MVPRKKRVENYMSNSYVSLFGQNVALRYNTIQQKKTNPPGRSIAYLYNTHKNHENFDRFLSSLFRVLLARAPQVIRGHSNMMSPHVTIFGT